MLESLETARITEVQGGKIVISTPEVTWKDTPGFLNPSNIVELNEELHQQYDLAAAQFATDALIFAEMIHQLGDAVTEIYPNWSTWNAGGTH